MLSRQQIASRSRRNRELKIRRLELRLDRNVQAAEKLHTGKTRARFMEAAQIARDQLREIDH